VLGWQGSLAWWLAMVSLVGFVACATLAVLRDHFLRLAAVRDYGALLVMFLLPVTFESLEQLAGEMLASVGSVLHTERGVTVLTILLTIAVLAPLWSLLQRLFVLLSAPRIRAVERSAVDVLERMMDDEDDLDPQAEIERFFRQADVEHYAIYARRSGNRFRLRLNRFGHEVPAEIELSGPLREFLADRPRFVDLHDVPFEWAFFFQQFELLRLQNGAHCRYLLPVCLGPSLRGLLLLPDDERAQHVTREAFAADVNRVGLEAVWR
jgi:hypothetical protein